jgi:hypothetical protein
MTFTTCIQDGAVTFTPDYGEESTGFSIVSGFTWTTIDETTGEISVDATEAFEGDFVILVKYTQGGNDITISITIELEDCAKTLLENSFAYCTGSGTYTQQIYLSDGTITGYTIDDPTEGVSITTGGLMTINTTAMGVGVNNMNIVVGGISYPFTVTILTCAPPSTSPIIDCVKDPIGIVWVNQEGGRQSYWFNQPKEFEINQADGKTYINTNKEKRYFSRGRVEYGVNIEQNFIPLLHLDSMNSLKNSIQAWVCTNITDLSTYKSIIIDEDTWVFRRTADRFFTIEFSFKFSKAKVIQRQ